MALIVWLPLNGNLNNKGMTSVTTTVSGTTSYTTGRIGEQALSCNGSSYWKITGLELTTEVTIACWSKTSANGKMQWVLESTASDRLNLYESDIYTLNTGDGNGNPFKDASNNNINCLHDGNWHHFAVTFGNNVAKLYIDGVYRGTASTFRNPTTTSSKTIKLAGGYGNAHSYDWNGAIEDFRVYNNCLTAEEIGRIVNAPGKGLVVWLPLNEDFRNQGLDRPNITTTNGSFVTGGKMGKCLKLGYTNNFTLSSLTNKKEITIAYWLKVNTATSTQWLDTFCYYTSDGSNSGYTRQELYNNCATTGFWFAGDSISGCGITVGEWTHFTITANYYTGEVCLYKNGILFQKKTTANKNHYITGVNFRIGENGLDLSYNDFRIYNSCLSPEQVKWLSKGLVLHWKLDQNGFGNTNIAKNSYINITNNSYNTANFNLSEEIVSGTQYTATIKGTLGSDRQYYGMWMGGGYTGIGQFTNHGNGLFTMTFTGPSSVAGNNSRTAVNIYAVPSSGSSNNTIKWIKIERGSKSTPWCPNSADTLATTMGLTQTKEHDCSGFGYDGTRTGTFGWTSNSPKYQASTYISDGSVNYIQSPSITLPGDKITMNFWFKSSNKSAGSSYHMPFESMAVDNYEMSIHNNGYLRGGLRINDTRYVDNCTSNKLTDGNWHMCTMTYDGTIIKRYVDGVMEKSTSITGTLKTSAQFIVGKYGSNNSYYSKEMYISDVRLYVTALSDNDVLALYNNTAALDTSTNPVTVYGKIR